ncbi:putative FlgJ-like protein [Desulfuromonas soudanensis]|uniref:Putative FlgJ-like protein n=1 Tax=Desulfuromonas soudanensis TaxID=1603606 RepID=A0A0M4D6Z6_9BACT|nr:glucosaminidase domain-containing protein [Desulfuromonas soudanensis]ALC16810.1 putative FlgJ-like protein [Desulfuromonas soudanensis]
MKLFPFLPIHGLLLAGVLSLGSCTEGGQPRSVFGDEPNPPVLSPASHEDLSALFSLHDYGWNTLNNGVPPFILNTLPTDLDRVPEISKKKSIFFLSILPMVLMINEEISQERATLLAIFDRLEGGESLSPEDRKVAVELAKKYRIEKNPLTSARTREALLKRVDIIPPSMVLAQAANESAYGTSRFALMANNLFGEWTFIPGTGLVPMNRPEGESYEVRRFRTVYDSVQSYIANLNTHWAYKSLRNKRAKMRREGVPLRGVDLAEGLLLYSTRGEAYVEDIQSIIRKNRLSRLSAAALRN